MEIESRIKPKFIIPASKPIALLIMLIINLVYGNDENKKSTIILGGIILFAANLEISIVNLLIA